MLSVFAGSIEIKKSLLDLKVEERCCIIGTLFKKMELKPNILKEISAMVGRHTYVYVHVHVCELLCPCIYMYMYM